MGQSRHHYEAAFDRYVRDRRIPYISVNEAKKSLLPKGAILATRYGEHAQQKLKNFDFVVYGEGTNLLVEVKGRRLPAIRLKDGTPAKPRMESWVTMADIEALGKWRALFGPEFEPMFVFVYWCDDVPPDGLFVETLVHQGRWYTLRAISLEAYVGAMKVRSAKWGTVHLSSTDFEALSRPFGAFAADSNEPAYVALGSGGSMG
ncbi:MAG: HYExAFE family protein [Phycisphaerales bacterium]